MFLSNSVFHSIYSRCISGSGVGVGLPLDESQLVMMSAISTTTRNFKVFSYD